jgi:hypothetical protein
VVGGVVVVVVAAVVAAVVATVGGTVVGSLVVGGDVVLGTVGRVCRAVVKGVVGTGVVDVVGEFFDPPLVATSAITMAAITTTAATARIIHLFRPLFCGRYLSVQAAPSQKRSTPGEPPGSAYHPAG